MCAQEHTQAGHQHHTADHDHQDNCCGPQCGAIADQRNRYYTGKYMTARDFRDEQEYFLSHHHLHNRLMHGWGIVCGLHVTPHRDDCPNYVVISPGIAIDCCGREIVLHERAVVQVWEPPMQTKETPPYGQTAQTAPAPAQLAPAYLLYVHYHEEAIECVPALYAEDCSAKRLEANRIHEIACLAVIPWDEAHQKDPRFAACWVQPGVNLEPCSKGCGAEDEKAEGCVEPDCPCAAGVPLALITPTRDGDVYRVNQSSIALGGRKTLPPPQEYLTRIVSTNWPHGGAVSLQYLRETMNGRLEIRFDRKLRAPYRKGAPLPTAGEPYQLDDNEGDEAIGINRQTFSVQYVGTQDDLEFLRSERRSPPHLEEDCLAVFSVRPDKLDPEDRAGNIAGNTIYVSLKCNFVLDCNGNPVDGDYLCGTFPTGDGVAGGTFESWFRVTYD
jgi:hypothetical protein